MLAHFGVDVLDPRTTLRRVRELMARLPPGSWPQHDHEMSWSHESWLLAQIIDGLAALNYTTMRAWGGKPPKPKPFPRPHGATPKTRQPAPRQDSGPQKSSWRQLAEALMNSDSPNVVVHRGG